MIWKSKEYMPGNGDNTCFTPGNVKYRYAMRTSSDLYREVLDDRKIFVMIFGEHYGVCQVPANAHCTRQVFPVHVRIYPNPSGHTLKGR